MPHLFHLKSQPEVRPSIPWRLGRELPPEKAINSSRVQRRGAVLLSTRGAVRPDPCEHCAAGRGRFSVCVTLKPWFLGACSSCIFNSKGNKCSLRTETSGKADARALRYDADDLESYNQTAAEQGHKPSKKRKRSSAPAQLLAQSKPYTSRHPPLDTLRSLSPDLEMLFQAEIAGEQSELESPVREVMQPSQHQHPSQPNVARPRGHSKATTAAPSPYRFHTENQRSIPRPLPPRGAAPMSQTGNETSTPFSVATWQNHSSSIKGLTLSIIDSLPPAKQRELYGFIGQCQAGIGNLQSQLDSLKSFLGIDDE